MTWTKERIAALKTPEIRQLRANAERLHEQQVVSLCDEVLGNRPKQSAIRRKVKRQHELDGRPLVSRKRAFELRGVTLRSKMELGWCEVSRRYRRLYDLVERNSNV